MKQFFKKYGGTLLFFGLVGLVGGFFTGLYLLDGYPAEFRQQLAAELSTVGLGNLPLNMVVAAITAVQSLGYGVVLGFAGIIIAKKVGLWKDERKIERQPLMAAVLVSIIGGMAIILPDMLIFGKLSDVIKYSYSAKPTLTYILASVTYGAVIEEVMLRLFFMSVAAFILFSLFQKGKNQPAEWVFIAANIISALLFAAGHLPATVMTIGSSPVIILRCFLLNGGIGLLFGRLYRKYGLRYAMLAHGGCHVVSKLIWILFI